MERDKVILLRSAKYCMFALSAFAVTGIATLMYIAREKDEDITGIVAPALLVTMITTTVGIVAAILERRASNELISKEK